MSWTYSTNMMGPMLHWYESNNIPYTLSEGYYSEFLKEENGEPRWIEPYKTYEQYAGGRIDCYCNDPEDPDFDHYGRETGLPIMEAKIYQEFSDWLDDVVTERFQEFDDLKEMYENETGKKLILFRENKDERD